MAAQETAAVEAPREPSRSAATTSLDSKSDESDEVLRQISEGSSSELHPPSLLGMVPVKDQFVSNPLRTKVPEGKSSETADVLVFDEMTYKPESLLGWYALVSPYRSVWSSASLWNTMGRLAMLSLAVALLSILLIPDPAALRVEVFLEISKFLTVFCGLLLGFFMTSSVKRWHDCARSFLELCDAIRNLQMQFNALGVNQESNDLCIRYGLLSGWLLKCNLEAEQTTTMHTDHMWEEICTPNNDAKLGCTPRLLPKEAAIVRRMKDPAAAIWTWISSLIGRMAQDGEIPAMPTPTYGRIMNLVQDAYNGIRGVRSSISVRAPFVYVHMLTSVVHINNILNAISLGVVMGIAISGAMIRHNLHYFHPSIRSNQNERDFQFFVITGLICVVGPMLYQALTEISISLSQPFSTEMGQIPIHRLLMMLEQDLREGKEMAVACPKWRRACFRHPGSSAK